MFKFSRTFIILFISIFVFFTMPTAILADNEDESLDDISNIKAEIIETASNPTTIPDINSRAAVVIDRNSNTILYGKNEKTKKKMASTTKIMTATVIIENCNLNDVVEVSKKAGGTGGSRLGLKAGDKITVRDLLYGLMLCSGNDAAVALSEHAGGSIEGFAELMNKKAKELGLENTNFETPHGLDKDNHYTTAYELALLSNYALNNDTFRKIVGTKSYTVTINGYGKTISNTNELLGNLNGVYGIKTGFTNGANRCLVTACKRGNLDIICVVLGADTKKFRTQDSVKLIEYAFNNFELVNIEELINTEFAKWQEENLDSFNIEKGQNQNVSIKYNQLKYSIIPIKKELVSNINVNIDCNKFLVAPIEQGTTIGRISVNTGDNNTDSNNNIVSTDILLDCTIRKKTVFDYFKYLVTDFKKILTI